MGATRLSAGRLSNLLQRARSVVFSDTQVDFPGTYAIDGAVWRPVIFDGLGEANTLDVDLAPDDFGSFENWTAGVPNGWTATFTGLADALKDVVNFVDGSSSAVLEPNGGSARLSRDYTCAAGEQRRFVATIWTEDVHSTPGEIYIQNLHTGHWYHDGVWDANEEPWATFYGTNATSNAEHDEVIELEGFAAALEDSVTIRVSLYANQYPVNFDAVHNWPCWDVASVHGHNAQASNRVALYGGNTSPAPNLIATTAAPPARPACYSLASEMQTYRYARLYFPGNSIADLYAGEIALWQSRTLRHGWTAQKRAHKPRQIRAETLGGVEGIIRLQADPPRTLDLTITSPTVDAFDALAGELFFRTREGQDPAFVIPDDDYPDVLCGRVPNEPLDVTPDPTSELRTYSVTFVEDALPIVGR